MMGCMAPLPVPTRGLDEFCRWWMITQLGVIGSVVRPDFHAESDVDVVVRFASESEWSLFDIVTMRDELAAIFGRPVDLIEESAVRNPYMLAAIRRTKRVLYAA
jgi:predicted nucleotidyltransferase